MGEGLQGETTTGFGGHRAIVGLHLFDDFVIIIRAADDGDIFVIFRRRPQHGGAANVNVINGPVHRHAILCNRFLEGIKVAHDHVNHFNVELVGLLHVRIVITQGQQAAVNFGMQCDDPVVHDLGIAGVIFDRTDVNARFFNFASRAAC